MEWIIGGLVALFLLAFIDCQLDKMYQAKVQIAKLQGAVEIHEINIKAEIDNPGILERVYKANSLVEMPLPISFTPRDWSARGLL